MSIIGRENCRLFLFQSYVVDLHNRIIIGLVRSASAHLKRCSQNVQDKIEDGSQKPETATSSSTTENTPKIDLLGFLVTSSLKSMEYQREREDLQSLQIKLTSWMKRSQRNPSLIQNMVQADPMLFSTSSLHALNPNTMRCYDVLFRPPFVSFPKLGDPSCLLNRFTLSREYVEKSLMQVVLSKIFHQNDLPSVLSYVFPLFMLMSFHCPFCDDTFRYCSIPCIFRVTVET